MNSIPLQIPFSSGNLFGILRNTEGATRLIILCPAATGTRIGPQRIFVEIAQTLLEKHVASFCVDFPPLGDSYDDEILKYEGSYSQQLSQHFAKYLNIVLNYFKENSSFKEIYLLSISDGCIPVYNFAKRQGNNINGLILLSPHHKLDSVSSINRKNIKQYLYKIIRKDSWIKLISLNLNYSKILKNIYHKRDGLKNNDNVELRFQDHIPRLLTLFGEKEFNLAECLDFWKSEISKEKIVEYSNGIIVGADHSFFGWQFKTDVKMRVKEWIDEN